MADDKLLCRNTGCKWNNKRGKCILFVGVTMLECQYRKPPTDQSKTSTKTKKKGK